RGGYGGRGREGGGYGGGGYEGGGSGGAGYVEEGYGEEGYEAGGRRGGEYGGGGRYGGGGEYGGGRGGGGYGGGGEYGGGRGGGGYGGVGGGSYGTEGSGHGVGGEYGSTGGDYGGGAGIGAGYGGTGAGIGAGYGGTGAGIGAGYGGTGAGGHGGGIGGGYPANGAHGRVGGTINSGYGGGGASKGYEYNYGSGYDDAGGYSGGGSGGGHSATNSAHGSGVSSAGNYGGTGSGSYGGGSSGSGYGGGSAAGYGGSEAGYGGGSSGAGYGGGSSGAGYGGGSAAGGYGGAVGGYGGGVGVGPEYGGSQEIGGYGAGGAGLSAGGAAGYGNTYGGAGYSGAVGRGQGYGRTGTAYGSGSGPIQNGIGGTYTRPTGYGSSNTGSSVVKELKVTCDKVSNTMQVEFEFYKEFAGRIYPRGYYAIEQCVAHGTGSSNLYVGIPLDGCGTVELDDTGYRGRDYLESSKNTFQNTIIVMVENRYNVIEEWDRAYIISCQFKGDENHPTLNYGVRVPEIPTEYHGTQESPVPKAILRVVKGHDPWAPGTDGLVVGEHATLIISHLVDNHWDLIITNCYAHDGVGLSKIQLVDEYGCPADPKFIQILKKEAQGTTSIVYGTFKAFKFPDRPNVYFQCSIQVCEETCGDQYCLSRQKSAPYSAQRPSYNTNNQRGSGFGGPTGGNYGPPAGGRSFTYDINTVGRKKRSVDDPSNSTEILETDEFVGIPLNSTSFVPTQTNTSAPEKKPTLKIRMNDIYRGVLIKLPGEPDYSEGYTMKKQSNMCISKAGFLWGITVMGAMVTMAVIVSAFLFIRSRVRPEKNSNEHICIESVRRH
ncbi:PREDICTED: uncharacterized protein LOC106808705, partial [Priapulus caudatus]|uniref:Uncharacterized protein LOC106808705 n=1 Tax=Priapulus caudatus TaxID=37621 RepID=A0ABM1E499_PRICU